jgi:hypothetical protein
MSALRFALGWLCFRAVLALPVRMDNRAYRWALAWAGYYAHHPTHVPSRP